MTPDSILGMEANSYFMRFVYSALAAMGLFITAFEKHDREKDKFQMENVEKAVQNYDFIIVGGGTAGSIVANRISQTYKTLLVEAGGEAFPFQGIPSMGPYMLGHKELDWMYQSVPQKYACQSLKKQKTNICQGKGLGGSSNMGPLNYNRGSPFDYENIASFVNDTKWTYSNLLPYFKRIENYQGIWTDPLVHGFDGELQLQTPNYTGMADRFIKAGMEMGYKMTDLNGLFTEGFDYILSPLNRGYRQSSNSAYLKPIRPKPNLDIKKFAHVQRILFRQESNGTKPTAYGIIYSRHGKLIMAVATKEVIISAGTVNTPQLLLLSGIGPKKSLKSLKIPLVKDHPGVGRNLQDHLITYIGPFMLNTSFESFLMERDLTPGTIAQFSFFNGQGPLTSTGIHANAILTSSLTKNGFKRSLMSQWSDLHITLYGMSHHSTIDQEFIKMFNLREDIGKQYFNDERKLKDSFSLIISGGRPYSRGKIMLADTNSSNPPLINPNYLSDPRDLEVMVDGVQKALKLVQNSKSFREIGASLSSTPFPSCTEVEFMSRAYWECYIKHFSLSSNNLVGTCKMGPPDSSSSVVDSELRVLGVDGLRIIDASVLPFIPVTGTLAPTMVIAEKGADMLRNFWDQL